MANKNPHAVALGRLGGKVVSDAKAHAARSNGRLGGRPRKQTEGERSAFLGKSSKYEPHQGTREKARRLKRLGLKRVVVQK